MHWELEIGDSVTHTGYWADFNESSPGTVTGRYWDDGQQVYNVKYGAGYKGSYYASNLKMIGTPLPVFEAEIVSIGAGRALYTFRAADAAEANAKVEGLVKGTSKSPAGETLAQMIKCKTPAEGWKERIIVMYIKQVR